MKNTIFYCIAITFISSCFLSNKSIYYTYDNKEKSIFTDFHVEDRFVKDSSFKIIQIDSKGIKQIIEQGDYNYYWIVVWAPWCETAEADIQNFIKIRDENTYKNVKLIMVSSEYEYKKLKKLMDLYKYEDFPFVVSLKTYGKYTRQNLKCFIKEIEMIDANYKKRNFANHFIFDGKQNLLYAKFTTKFSPKTMDSVLSLK